MPGRLIRPKSIATVVVVLPVTCERSSIPSEAEVITASVVSGSISLTAVTNVVLPTPKPPATTILTGNGGATVATGGGTNSECAETIEHLLKYGGG